MDVREREGEEEGEETEEGGKEERGVCLEEEEIYALQNVYTRTHCIP